MFDHQTYVYYHAGCNDGFAAAWAWRHAYKQFAKDPEEASKISYIPIAYNNEATTIQLVVGEPGEVFFLDYCPKVATIKTLLNCENLERITVIDHHITGEQRAAEFPESNRLRLEIDMNYSGCALTWWWMHDRCRETPLPLLIRYVQDRDLWTWEMNESRAVNARLQSEPHDFVWWDALHSIVFPSSQFENYIEQGQAILSHSVKAVDQICSAARLVHVLNCRVPIVNCQYMMSEVGERLNQTYPESKFAVIWYMLEDGRIRVSLRTQHADFDVSELAEKFGGGGHPRAAGFVIDVKEGRDVDIMNYFLDHNAVIPVV